MGFQPSNNEASQIVEHLESQRKRLDKLIEDEIKIASMSPFQEKRHEEILLNNDFKNNIMDEGFL
jgi:hypothetical protein